MAYSTSVAGGVSPTHGDVEKYPKDASAETDPYVDIRGLETSESTSLHRGLKARHISMIAIGGALGTGLIIGTGAALADAGPGSLFISYAFMGSIVYMVMTALGEMAAWMPLSAGFTGYASRYCHPSLGFTLGWTYWFKYIIVTPNQLTAAALVIQEWVSPERVNPGVFIAVFLVTILCINYFGGIKFFGEFEFWLSSIKVIVIIGIILFCIIIAAGGGPSGEATGFTYWRNPGAFAPYKNVNNPALAQFVGFWSVMVNATFAFLGTELVGVTAGEAQNPRRSIPKAIKLTFYRILFFYVLSVFLIGLIVPYNSDELAFANEQNTGASASPFVVAAKLAGVKSLPGLINGCILVFVFSAANSDLYIASRTLYGLASDRSAPAIFRRTDRRGVPYPSLFLCAAIACLAFMNVADDTRTVFKYFVNLTTIFGLLTWISILVTHIHFVKARRVQNVPNSELAYRAPLGAWGSRIALFFCCLVALTKNFTVFIRNGEPFDYATFITGYLGIPLYLMLIFGHMFVTKSRGIPAKDVDLYTGKAIIDKEEIEFVQRQRELMATRTGWNKFYNRFISWLF
ncbi:Dicarboxylic amino acid permease-like protein [Hapsidospora chrysogenum ATCC 11550]|uniref:Dicarboxylic amino acid permease-like protein n=1 Tax=Hapsidospora chrysogenum (strain ATCC 11550 / CBS 779.69 / DSM 880 / IAM 14645 / JCM 23072 / IMI 49137) TaxID=857340 RepID=A0A086STC0_HAPC1|nr:Dicarboxylic amino acid permease-like protein [Hapsidospora chrysogenum ATCC 11550]